MTSPLVKNFFFSVHRVKTNIHSYTKLSKHPLYLGTVCRICMSERSLNFVCLTFFVIHERMIGGILLLCPSVCQCQFFFFFLQLHYSLFVSVCAGFVSTQCYYWQWLFIYSRYRFGLCYVCFYTFNMYQVQVWCLLSVFLLLSPSRGQNDHWPCDLVLDPDTIQG